MIRKPVVYFIDDSATMREVIKIAFLREENRALSAISASGSFPSANSAMASSTRPIWKKALARFRWASA